ncbi:hypothetical protein ES705_33455 [subsurface metagenome]
MSLDQINDYGIGDCNLSSLMQTVDRQRRGYQAISLTHYDDNLEPKIAAGSIVEIGGALFKCEADEPITGWAGIGDDNDVYIKLVPSGQTATAAFTTAAPIWSTSKQGWYVGNDRYVAGLYKDVGGNYTKKWLYEDICPSLRAAKIRSGVASETGDVVITGVGFRPSVILFFTQDADTARLNQSFGFDDGTVHHCMGQQDAGAQMCNSGTESIYIRRDVDNKIVGYVSALGSDGFTIIFTETGTASCRYFYLCLP